MLCDEMRENRRTNPVFVLGGRWLANDNAIWFHPFADFHPLAFPIVPVVRRTGSKNLAGSPRGRRGEGRERDFIVGQFIPHSALRPIR